MKVVIMESLGISEEELDRRKKPLEEKGCQFVSYPKTTDVEKMKEEARDADAMIIANMPMPDEVLSACRYYFQKTGRRLTFEYSLVGGENDSQEDAEELARLIKGLNCHVNLIPVNPIKERNYVQSDKKVIENFQNKLEKYQINVTIRREMGRDIDGACGQLRKRYLDKREDS